MNKSTHIKNVFLSLSSIIFCLVQLNCAFAFDFASSPNPVGSGARAMGMGGAFIAVADDATAASWNPGGLVQLKTPEISVVGNCFHRTEDVNFANHPEASGSESVSKEDLNYLSMVYPFNLFNRNMVVSLNYQKLYDFAREWDFQFTGTTDTIDDSLSFPGLPPMIIHTTTKEKIHYEQSGGLSALGIACSIQIVPQLSFGFTLNIWDNDLTPNKWEKIYYYASSSTVEYYGISVPASNIERKAKDEYSFNGLNFNIGMLWRITDKLTTGLVFKTPFTADVKHERYEVNDQNQSEKWTLNEKLDMPMSCGIGLLYKISDEFRVSADVYRTEWQDYIYTNSDGKKISFITNKSKGESDIDPTYQVRFGMEYLLVNHRSHYVIPLRAGVFYDPVPAQASPDDYYGFSLGSGFSMEKYAFDIAYQYKFGNDVGSSFTQGTTLSQDQDVEEHMVYSSFIIYF
ncbi:MAG: outer membrane protein transport protein [Deltaproteobacteria bacterium]|nr:outer membrane protein transport protein [Deltaproteobacteria bacterium]